MIDYLSGKLVEKAPTRVVLDVAGVGYEVFIPLSSYDRLPETGELCCLKTHFHVREDAHIFFGFFTDKERSMFRMLLGTSGIGPKLAMAALSGLSVRDLRAAVVRGDTKMLSSISGIGKKVAERIIIELRDKFSEGESLEAVAGEEEKDSQLRDAVLALVALGYKQEQARKMVVDVVESGRSVDSVEDLVRKSLGAQ